MFKLSRHSNLARMASLVSVIGIYIIWYCLGFLISCFEFSWASISAKFTDANMNVQHRTSNIEF